MTWSKTHYLETRPWTRDRGLVIPPGTKVCLCCGRNWYSSEFVSCSEYVDNKLPVCSFCLRSRSERETARGLIDDTQVTRKCEKCDGEKGLGQFCISFTGNKVTNKCLECETARIEANLDKGDVR